MKYHREGPPYEHTCPKCGRHQKVKEYDQNPRFEVGTVEEIEEDGIPGVVCEMGIELNKHFKCIACGGVQRFDDSFVDIDVSTKMLLHDKEGEWVDINDATRKVKREFRKEHDIEEYL